MKIRRFTRILVSLALTLALAAPIPILELPASAANTTYYIDSAGGNDSNNGLSESTPWRTLSKVSNKTTFQPGDRILLKCGSVFTGANIPDGGRSDGPFILASSGAAGNPIIIGSYGEGPKPIINGNGAYAAINVNNQQYFTIQDLELTNYNIREPEDFLTEYHRRSGIWIKAYDNGPKRGITIKNMTIHQVTGMSVTGETTVTTEEGDTNVNKNANAGILMNSWQLVQGAPKARYEDLLLENNTIYEVAGPGISIDGFMQQVPDYHKNVVVRGNSVNMTGADGIIIGVCDAPIVEYNVSYNAGRYGNGSRWIAGIWFWRTNNGLMQYNEVGRVYAREKEFSDSAAFDTDVLTSGDHIFQYNYSHDNEGGFFMDMGRLVNGKNILRYNISENDKRDGHSSNTMNTTDTGLYYNNIFYNDEGDGISMKNNPKAVFVNNIFYTTDTSAASYPAGSQFYYNSFYGQPAPAQAKASILGDPGFIAPGQGGDGRDSLEGYKLRTDSPLIGAGKFISGNPGGDFWGNSLYAGRADIGAFELPGSTAGQTPETPDIPQVTVTEVLDTSVTLRMDSLEDGIPPDAEVYDTASGEVVASAMFSNEITVKNLTPDTSYTFSLRVRNAAGNYSGESSHIPVTTRSSVFLDDSEAVKTGTWTVSTTDMTTYDGDCSRANAGTGQSTLTWTPDIPQSGYYAIYAWMTRGGTDRARNAPFTVSSGGRTKTYYINQTPLESGWKNIGIQRLSQGTDGYIQLTNNANGIVTADAVKLVYLDDFSYDDIETVNISTDKLQLAIGETTGLTVTGVDGAGRQLDLVFDGAEVEYMVDNPGIAAVDNGIVTGLAEGTTFLSAGINLSGRQITSNRLELFVGGIFQIRPPVFTDANGTELTALTGGTVNTTVTVVNSTEKKMRMVLVAALYSPQGLVRYGTFEKAVFEDSIVDLAVGLTLPEDLTGHYMRVYLWDSLATLRPLADVTIWP